MAEGAVQLGWAGVPGGLDRADPSRCANRPPASPAGHYVSANGPTESIRSGGGAALASGESPPLVGSLFVCSRWQCYSSHHRTQRVCYSLLLRLLRTIDAGWDPTAVRGDLVGGPEKKEKKKKESEQKGKLHHLISSSLAPIKVFGQAKNVWR